MTLALGAMTVTGAAAATTFTPATGSLTCGVQAGQMASLSPGIPMSGQPAATMWTMAKVHQVALDTCDVSGVTGGRSAITGGVVHVNARLDRGASCDTLATSLSSVNKAVMLVKLTNTVTTTTIDPVSGLPVTTTQTSTIASVHVKTVTATPTASGVLLSGVAQQSASGSRPFGGETVEVQLNMAGDCSTAPLTTVDLTGSTVSIHP